MGMFLIEYNKYMGSKMSFISQSFAVRAKNEILALDASVTLRPLFSLVKYEGFTSRALEVHLCLLVLSRMDNKACPGYPGIIFFFPTKKGSTRSRRNGVTRLSSNSIWPKSTRLMTSPDNIKDLTAKTVRSGLPIRSSNSMR